MAKLFPWDPWLELECMKEDMKRLVEDTTCVAPFPQGARRLAQFRPVADVIELAEGYMILVELPGLEREDVTLEVHGNELTLYGERKLHGNITGAAFHVLERSYGSFARRFSLPLDIDPSAVEASMKSGLLSVMVPKRPQGPRNRQINISLQD